VQDSTWWSATRTLRWRATEAIPSYEAQRTMYPHPPDGRQPVKDDGDCEHHGSWGLGSMVRANIREPLLTVVTVDKPKMLIGLNQKVRDRSRRF
jgi:hypothetical protein